MTKGSKACITQATSTLGHLDFKSWLLYLIEWDRRVETDGQQIDLARGIMKNTIMVRVALDQSLRPQ
jgi:hypothetical protein